LTWFPTAVGVSLSVFPRRGGRWRRGPDGGDGRPRRRDGTVWPELLHLAHGGARRLARVDARLVSLAAWARV